LIFPNVSLLSVVDWAPYKKPFYLKVAGMSLPLELLKQTTEDVEDQKSFLALRLTSRTFNSLTTPLVFHVLNLRDNANSAGRVSCLQTCEAYVREAVKEVVLHGDSEGEPRSILVVHAPLNGPQKNHLRIY
jgi:hypothetical protein